VKGSSCAAKERGDTVCQQRFEGIGERKVEDDLALEDLDALAEAQRAGGRRFSGGEDGWCRIPPEAALGALQQSATERVHENVGGAVEEQSRVPRDSNL